MKLEIEGCVNFNPDELERQNRTGLSIFTFYIKVVGAHVSATKGSAVPVAVWPVPRLLFRECVCVCGIHPQPCCWSNPQRETAVAASMGWGGREFQILNVQWVGMQQLGRRDPRLLESA